MPLRITSNAAARLSPKKENPDLARLKRNWADFRDWRECQTIDAALILPMPHNKANTRVYWRIEKEMKVLYTAYLDYMLKRGLIPPPPKTPPARATISATMYLSRKMDTGNAFNRFKYIEDWLVRNGYLQDDSEAHLEWLGIPKQVLCGKTPPRIEIVLTPVEATE